MLSRPGGRGRVEDAIQQREEGILIMEAMQIVHSPGEFHHLAVPTKGLGFPMGMIL